MKVYTVSYALITPAGDIDGATIDVPATDPTAARRDARIALVAMGVRNPVTIAAIIDAAHPLN